MSDDRSEFLDLVKEIESKQAELLEAKVRLGILMVSMGVGTYLQDPDTSTVYKIVKPKGTFTYYSDIDYTRTAQDGERAGTLSKKEAEEAGFQLLKK